jgi:hypothetical protein
MPPLISGKQWWAPVWKGLVMDSDAKHYRKMKSALWLYLYCLLAANRTTGLLTRKIRTISVDMGVPRDTVIRWLDALRAEGYVATSNTGRSLTIQVRHFKSLRGHAKNQLQKSDFSNFRYGRYPISAGWQKAVISDQNSPRNGDLVAANKNEIKININNTMQISSTDDERNGMFPGIGDSTRRELLAHEVATALDDKANVARYRECCAQYPEGLIRRILAEVEHMPAAHAPNGRTRAALFTYCILQYAPRTPEDSRD